MLQTDATDRGVGLSSQMYEEEDYPVAYFSWNLLLRKEKYSVVEEECLVIQLAGGTSVQSVHARKRPFRSLEWLDWLKDSNIGLMRWSLALQPFQFTV